jgi:hypothetical protein
VRIGDFTFPVSSYFGTQSRHWATLIIPRYCDMPPAVAEYPGFRERMQADGLPDWVIMSRHRLSATVWASPAYWSDEPALPSPEVLCGRRWAEVRFPSLKGLLLDIASPALNAPPSRHATDALVGLADGSARIVNWSAMDGELVSAPPAIQAYPIFTTKGGLTGIDFR